MNFFAQGSDPEEKLSEALARSARNVGVRGREPPEKFLGATPFRSSENAPFGLKLAELSKQVLATYPSEKARSSTAALSFGWQAARVLHFHFISFHFISFNFNISRRVALHPIGWFSRGPPHKNLQYNK